MLDFLRWSFPLGSLSGIRVYIHWSFTLLLAYVIYVGWQQGSPWADTLFYLALILTVFGCVTLHELGHALAARRYGIATQQIVLSPLGGVAFLEGMPERPLHELIVAIAGPAVNIVIALLLGAILSLGGINWQTYETGNLSIQFFLLNLFFINLTLVAFNAIPAFPMDGGRVLRAILSMRLGKFRATRIAAIVGQLFAVLFVLAGIFWLDSPVLPFIGLFIFLGATTELRQVTSDSALANYLVQPFIRTQYTPMFSHNTLDYALKKMLSSSERNFLVFDLNGTITGTLSYSDLWNAAKKKQLNLPIKAVMNTDIVLITPDTPLKNAYAYMNATKTELLPVMQNDVVVGVLDLRNMVDLIRIKSN